MTASKKNVLVIHTEDGEQLASDLQRQLDGISYVTLKNQIIELPMENSLQNLLTQLKLSDYGILVVTNKDLESYNKEIQFLAGLLIGNLGTNRIALLIPDEYNMSSISKYLEGYKPSFYRSAESYQLEFINTSIFGIRKALDNLEKRITESDYTLLYNKKELLRIALSDSDAKIDKFNPFLSSFIKFFDAGNYIGNAKAMAATLFALSGDYVKQVGAAGEVHSKGKFKLTDSDEYVVKCLHQENDLLLNENHDIFTGDENSYEYIFCKSIHDKYVLTVHIRCSVRIPKEQYNNYMQNLSEINAGYIAVLQLFLKGGSSTYGKNHTRS